MAEAEKAKSSTSSEERLYTVRNLVAVEPVGYSEYKGLNLWQPSPTRSLYGGQVVGQALMSAWLCVSNLDPSFLLHSFHCYFVGPTKATSDVIYKVARVKDGNNFCSVSVTAVQDSKVSFHCLVSFQKPVAMVTELEHCGYPMPALPHPDDPAPDTLTDLSDDEIIAFDVKRVFPSTLRPYPIPLSINICLDVATAKTKWANEAIKPHMPTWMKGQGMFEKSDDQNLHRIALAFATDFMLATMVLHLYPKFKLGLVASLDHSMWFHSPVSSSNWHLYDTECHNCMDGRSLNGSRIYAEDASLVATCMQEALIRPKL